MLHVFKASSVTGTIESSATNSLASMQLQTDASGLYMRAYGSTATGSLSDGTSLTDAVALLSYSAAFSPSRMVVGTAAPVPLNFATNLNVRATIDGSGNMGIGTTSPNRLLEVAGAVRFSPTTTPASPAAGDMFFDSAASNTLKFYDGGQWRSINTGTGFAAAGANSDITSLNALTAINGASLAIGNSATTTLNVGGAATGALTATFGANTSTSTTTVSIRNRWLELERRWNWRHHSQSPSCGHSYSSPWW